jgi:phage gp29-like protein
VPVYDDPTSPTPTSYKDPVLHTVEQLQNLRNGSVGAGVDTPLTVIAPQNVGEAFQAGVDLFNREIATGILATTRATQEAEHGSRADSTTAQDVVGLLVAYIRGWLAATVRADVLAPLVLRNFGPDALALLPVVHLAKTEQQDFATDANAVAQLERAGYLAPSQKPQIDARLGLPVRTPEETVLEAERHAAPPVTPGPPQADGQDDSGDNPAPPNQKEQPSNGKARA